MNKLLYFLIFIFFVLLILITMELLFGLISGEIPIWMKYVIEQHGGI